MYNVALVNLSADARTVAALAHIERRDVAPAELQDLLRNFCELDPVENATNDAEIRVHVRHEKYLLRTEQKKLILYDVNQRDLPAQSLTVEQAMLELDGSAATARAQAILAARAEAGPVETAEAALPAVAPPPIASRPRVMGLTGAAVLLLAALIWLAAPMGTGGTPAEFVPIDSGEQDKLQAALTGVYLTGSEPGQHGIVVTGPGEMKLFELAAVAAPRVVPVSYQIGRRDAKLCLATDQPGGLVEVRDDGALVYCGEVYQRIP